MLRRHATMALSPCNSFFQIKMLFLKKVLLSMLYDEQMETQRDEPLG